MIVYRHIDWYDRYAAYGHLVQMSTVYSTGRVVVIGDCVIIIIIIIIIITIIIINNIVKKESNHWWVSWLRYALWNNP